MGHSGIFMEYQWTTITTIRVLGCPTLTPVQPQGFHGIARQDSLMRCYTKERGQAMYVLCLVGGFNPLKNTSQLGLLFPMYGKNKFQTTNQVCTTLDSSQN